MQNCITRTKGTRISQCVKLARGVFTYKKDITEEEVAAKPFNSIPGPRRLPVIGNLHLFSRFGPYSFEKLYEAYADLHKKYGPIVRLEVGLSMVALFDPTDIQTILSGDERYPDRPLLEALRYHRLQNKEIYGGSAGMVTENGPEWKRVREAVNFIMSPKFVENYFPAQEEIATDFANRIKGIRDSNKKVCDFLQEIYRFTEESIGLVCFGIRLGLIDTSKRGTDADVSSITEASEQTVQSFADTFLGFPWWKYFNTPAYQKLVNSQMFFQRFATDCLKTAAAKLDANPDDPNLTFFKTLYEKKGITAGDIRLLMVELFSAGIDTTGNMIGFMLYNLAKNPEAQETLYDEIQTHVPSDGQLTKSDLDKLKYLKACLKESYRITPSAGGTGRILKKETILSGYLVPPKVLCIALNPIICRLPEYFEDPLNFKPERWLNDTVKPHPYAILPFSHGVRSCVGQRIAGQEILLCVLKIIQKYRVKYEGPKIGRNMRLALVPDKPLNFIFEDRIKK